MARDIVTLDTIRKINIDPCTACNHRCAFCPNPDPRTVRCTMKLAHFTAIMDDLTAHITCEELGLSAKGEPLLNPDLAAMIRLAKTTYAIPYTYISTNGALLTPERLDELLEAGLDSIKFSINAFDRDSYRRVHGRDDHPAVMTNLANAAEAAAKQGTKLIVSSIGDWSEEDIREHLASEIGAELADAFSVWVYTQLYMPNMDAFSETVDYRPCPYLFTGVYVSADGSLAPCCIDYFGEIALGNLLETSITELFNGPAMRDLRRQHLERGLDASHLCYRCLTDSQRFTEFNRHKAT